MSNVFVNYDEKKALIVERPDIIDHTDPNNPWDEVIDKFVKQSRKYKKRYCIKSKIRFHYKHKSIKNRFRNKFNGWYDEFLDYTMVEGFGIPEIRVAGEKADWECIKEKIAHLVSIIPQIKDWTGNLNEIIDEFISVFDNKINIYFWKGIYHFRNFFI